MIDQRSLEIHQRAIACAKQYRKSESDLIDALAEIDSDRTYLKFEKPSLYQYAIDFLMLSEDRAVTLISIMRKSKRVPELKQAIRDGNITVSKAVKIVPVLTTENKSAWLELAASSTSRAIEKAVALENPKLATKESLKYKTQDRLELVMGVSEEWEKLLKCVQDIASQKQDRAVSREDALKLAMECYLEKHDPLQKANRAKSRKEKKTVAQAEASNTKPGSSEELAKKLSVPGRINPVKRKPINSALKHAVMWRDQRRCTHQSRNGDRCTERRWLDVHHRVPVSHGGPDTLENLTTLCSRHHSVHH